MCVSPSCVLYDRHKGRRERRRSGVTSRSLVPSATMVWIGSFAGKCIHATITNVATRVRRYAWSVHTPGFIQLARPGPGCATACPECYGHVDRERPCHCARRYERESDEGARTGRRRDQYDRQRARGEVAVAGDCDGSDPRRGLLVSRVVLQLALELRKGRRGLPEAGEVRAPACDGILEYRRGVHVVHAAQV